MPRFGSGAEHSGRERRSARGRLAGVGLLTGTLLGGCTALLDIDDVYVEEPGAQKSSGGTSSSDGGSLGSGGSGTGGPGTGGGSDGGSSPAASGGEPPATGGTTPAKDAKAPGCTDECGADAKCCDGICTPKVAGSGCGNPVCSPCPRPPDDGTADCDDAKVACIVKCNIGYRLVGEPPQQGEESQQVCELIPSNTGGTSGGGAAGSGGSVATGGAPACTQDACQRSIRDRCTNPVLGLLSCCKNDNTCGCTWAPELRGITPYCL